MIPSGCKDLLGLLEQLGRKGLLDSLGLLEQLVPQEHKGLLDPLDHKELFNTYN